MAPPRKKSSYKAKKKWLTKKMQPVTLEQEEEAHDAWQYIRGYERGIQRMTRKDVWKINNMIRDYNKKYGHISGYEDPIKYEDYIPPSQRKRPRSGKEEAQPAKKQRIKEPTIDLTGPEEETETWLEDDKWLIPASLLPPEVRKVKKGELFPKVQFTYVGPETKEFTKEMMLRNLERLGNPELDLDIKKVQWDDPIEVVKKPVYSDPEITEEEGSIDLNIPDEVFDETEQGQVVEEAPELVVPPAPPLPPPMPKPILKTKAKRRRVIRSIAEFYDQPSEAFVEIKEQKNYEPDPPVEERHEPVIEQGPNDMMVVLAENVISQSRGNIEDEKIMANAQAWQNFSYPVWVNQTDRYNYYGSNAEAKAQYDAKQLPLWMYKYNQALPRRSRTVRRRSMIRRRGSRFRRRVRRTRMSRFRRRIRRRGRFRMWRPRRGIRARRFRK